METNAKPPHLRSYRIFLIVHGKLVYWRMYWRVWWTGSGKRGYQLLVASTRGRSRNWGSWAVVRGQSELHWLSSCRTRTLLTGVMCSVLIVTTKKWFRLTVKINRSFKICRPPWCRFGSIKNAPVIHEFRKVLIRSRISVTSLNFTKLNWQSVLCRSKYNKSSLRFHVLRSNNWIQTNELTNW